MDEHGLPIVGAGVDYRKVPALEHKTTLAFLNKYIIHTTQFLNKFSNVCEERLSELLGRIQRLDISLNILEAKLSSIPDLEDVVATKQYEPPPNVVSAGGASTGSGAGSAANLHQSSIVSSLASPPVPAGLESSTEPILPPQPQTQGGGQKAKDDPRYQKYYKMKRMGVSPLQIAMNMKREGLNPDVIEDEDAVLPGEDVGVARVVKKTDNNRDSSEDEDSDDEKSESNSSSEASEQDSDDSFGYD